MESETWVGIGVVAVIAGVLWVSAFAWLGRYVSDQKGRDSAEGVWIGGLFGPFGVMILALLPEIVRSPRLPTRADVEGSAADFARLRARDGR